MSSMRIGVAGLGGMGVVHAQNAAVMSEAELVAVAAMRPGRAQDVARELGVQALTYAELFAAKDVDAVVLAARSVDHAPLACDVLAQGKHLLLEKPGATTLATHDALLAAAATTPELVVQVGYMRRYDAAFAEAARIVTRGDIGMPLVVLLTSRDTQWPLGEDPIDTGGFLVDMAVHDYDAACWFLGQEPVEVFAARNALVYPELAPLGDLDNGVVTVQFDGGGIAVSHVSRTCAFGHDIRCEIVGSEGSVLVGNRASRDGVTILRRSDGAAFPQDFRERFADAYCAQLEGFLRACRGGPRGPGLEEDRRAVSVGVAARASAVAGEARAVGTDWPWPA